MAKKEAQASAGKPLATQCWKHLRPYNKRKTSKRRRVAGRVIIRRETGTSSPSWS